MPQGGSSALVEELRRAEAAFREQKDLAETLLRAQSEMGEGVLVVEGGRIAYANEAAGRLLGRPSDELLGLDSYLEIIAPEHRASLDESMRGPGGVKATVETTILRRDGRRLPVEVCAKSMQAGGGTRLVALLRDLSTKKAVDRQRFELAAEQAARAAAQAEGERWALFARLGDRLAESMDFETRLKECARTLAPDFADACAVFVREPNEETRLAAFEPPEATAMAQKYALQTLVENVLETGQAMFRSVASGSTLGGESRAPGLIVAPLAARGRTFGAIVLLMMRKGQTQGPREVAFVQEIARRTGLLLDNAHWHSQAQSAQAAAEKAVQERDTTLLNLRKNLRLLQSIVEGTTDLVYVKDLEGRYVLVNSAFVQAYHRSLAETLGRDDAALLPLDAANAAREHDRQVLDVGEPQTFEETVPIEGDPRTFLVTKAPYRDSKGLLIGIVGIARDITSRAQDERRLRHHAAQQEAVAEIGRAALAGVPLHELFDRAVRLTAGAVETDFAHVFEVTPDTDRMLLRAGVGWPEGIVGQVTVGAGGKSHAGYTLAANAPVIVHDIASEKRFRPSRLLLQHGVKSGVTVPILSGTRAIGVLGAHARERRTFATQDVLFLQAVANILATAIERGWMEEALREREERLRTVVMGAPVAIFAFDNEGRFTLSEGRGLDYLGLLPRRTLGRTISEALPQAADLAEGVRRALTGETVTGSLEAGDHAYETRLVPIRGSSGTITGVVGVATDVTDRRRAERRRKVQYAVSRLLMESESVEEAGPKLVALLAERLGWPRGLLWMAGPANDTLSYAAGWSAEPPDAAGIVAAARETTLRAGEDIAGIVWSTGRPVWVSDVRHERSFRRSAPAARDRLRTLVCLPVAGPQNVFGVIELYSKEERDLDEDLLGLLSSIASQFGLFIERRNALLEVRRLNGELESRVTQRTRELEAANRELEAFSYSVSHDLRAPLRTIDGFSQALLEDYSKVLDDEGRHLLGRVRAGTQRMAQLIDDLLKLSRITRGDLQRVPVDLGALVEATVAALRQQDPARSVEVSVQSGNIVEADAALLRVAIDNLVGNSWKFTRDRADARIEFGSQTVKGETVFFIRDNGAGFDMSYANKLFIPFQRLHRAAEFEGSGIGLATVHRIVQRHGGRVWAEGRVGAGATVYFTLGPAAASA